MNHKLTLASFFATAALAGATTFTEDFANPPTGHGWQVFGDTNLFHWNGT
ncbi:MAG: hypothetical protein JWR69_4136, partial [Pedosphaera sp.]|nr:hypothetical protein [Pedosphaera sp.]